MNATIESTLAAPSRVCGRCATELPPFALACPACAALVHSNQLKALAERATAAVEKGDRTTARALWEEALTLVPPRSQQHHQISARLSALVEEESPHATNTATGGGNRSWWTRGLGAAAAVALLVAGKFKFLLLGLSKLSTFVSMFGFIAVYWSIHGWPLAVGMALSIYVHEMGHVAMLRNLGIQAGAPLFIPGVGALVMLKERITDPVIDARIGLAGPVWGLGAAVAAWLAYLATGAAIWLAIAELTGFINLFNLIPVWQLDGARGFHALSRQQRWVLSGVIALALWASGVGVLWLVGAVVIFRAVRDQPGPGHQPTLVTFSVLVLALSWFARSLVTS